MFSQYKDGRELLKAMHKKYANKYCKTVVFEQKTYQYKNDTLKNTSYWYEWIDYPDKFRIDFGKKFGGDCVVFKEDSAFNFSHHNLVKAYFEENDLLLLLGGMYFRLYDDAQERLLRMGYDLDTLASSALNGKPCYVVGKQNSFRFYVDKKDLKVVGLRTKFSEKEFMEIHFDGFKKSCGGYTETKVTAVKKGKVIQKEEYENVRTNVAIPDSIFHKR